MKPQPTGNYHGLVEYTKRNIQRILRKYDFTCGISATPKYQVGEIVYLKEPYSINHGRDCDGVIYRFDDKPMSYDFWDKDTRWKNKLFMPESVARYFIKITAVRAERLQEISEEDCFNEGIIGIAGTVGPAYKVIRDAKSFPTPREAYAALTDKINGKGMWNSNPWVWVYDYELTNKQ